MSLSKSTFLVYLKIYSASQRWIFEDFIYLFIERGEGRENEKERNINAKEERRLVAFRISPALGPEPTTQACALTRDRTSDLLFCGTIPNRLSHTGLGHKDELKKKKAR